MRNVILALALAAGALSLAACGGGDDPLGLCFLDEQRQRDLRIEAGAQPRFSWCGAPAQTLVLRSAGGGGAVFWRLECVYPERCNFPTVTYGQEPSVTPPQAATAGPLDLVTGTTYEVCVSQAVPVEATLCAAFTQ